MLAELEAQGAKLYGISVDSAFAHKAFQEHLGISIPLLADFHPKGEVSRAYGVYIEERGHNQRALVMIGPDLEVEWSYRRPRRWRSRRQPDLRRARSKRPPDGLAARAPPPGPDDHVRGEGTVVIEYGISSAPTARRTTCMLAASRRRVFRHFPVASKHPRAAGLAEAAEAAALQGCFWDMHDSLLADQGHLDDPHLWKRASGCDSTSSASSETVAPRPCRARRPRLPLRHRGRGHHHTHPLRGREGRIRECPGAACSLRARDLRCKVSDRLALSLACLLYNIPSM